MYVCICVCVKRAPGDADDRLGQAVAGGEGAGVEVVLVEDLCIKFGGEGCRRVLVCFLDFYIYIYNYVCICVCMCVCV